MRKLKVSKIWIPAFLLAVLAGGCGREQTGFVAPTVISTNPANLATAVPVAQVITATFNVAMNPTTINTVTFTVAPTGGAALMGTVNFSGTTATFTPAANLLPSTPYTATITTGAQDPAGNALAPGAAPNPWTFTTGTIPTVTSTNPVNNATLVPLNQKITATFSEPMNPATINGTTFTLTGPPPASTPVPALSVTYDAGSNTAIFTPAANLTASTVYTATITTGAISAGGNALGPGAVPNPWTFTTGTTTNTIAPTIISTIPVNNALNVPINQKVFATFSKAMNPATINGTTFTLTGPGTTPVAGLVTYAAGSNTAVFTPATNLAPSILFTATVTSGAQDLTGNALVVPGVAPPNPWKFTTGTTANTTAPTITLTNPVNGATGVPLSATANATFSEAMDPTTITSANFTLTGPPGATPVTGTVSYAPATFIATFTPASPLVKNTQYTATVTNGAKDQFGNALVVPGTTPPNPWSFTTGPPFIGAGPSPINLRSAARFGDFGGTAGMTNQGINTMINNGDIGTTAVSTGVTGFHDSAGCVYTETPLNVGAVSGTIFTAAPPPAAPPSAAACTTTEGNGVTAGIALTGKNDALTAYNSMVALPPGPDPGAGQLGALTLAPGVYTAASGSFMITGTDLTLDAQGNANAVWVFQMSTSLTVGAAGPTGARSVILKNGALAKNVFWQVGSAATINGAGGGTMVGTIIAQSAVTVSTQGNNLPSQIVTLNGRAIVLVGPVTIVNTVINVP
ncbi:MAG TPA: Ig-like domain-containing protein [Candidatus Acidoferrum sp.]|nr:Ig-like domain-containing protein [Candidatus Acidoferrum sp.]